MGIKWTRAKVAIIALCVLSGYVCGAHGEELERAGIMTKDQGTMIAALLITGGVSWIVYKLMKRGN